MLLCLAALGLPLGGVARADSWPPPETQVTLSANGQFRFTSFPADESKVEAYYEDHSAGRSAARPNATGRLERKRARGGWETVWKGPLANLIAPTDALVANDGRYVVTFDNWYSTGHGENVIVIYRSDGTVVRSLAVSDLVPPVYQQLLPHSVSSLTWKNEARLLPDGETLLIDVLVPKDPTRYDEPDETVRFTITLADGAAHLPEASAWSSALAKTRTLALARVEAHLEWLDFMRTPLLAPHGCDGREWESYLDEAVQRLIPKRENGPYPSTYVLDPKDLRKRSNAVFFLRLGLTKPANEANVLVAAAPCNAGALARELTDMMPEVKEGSLTQTTLYLSVRHEEFDRSAQVLAPSGVQLVWLDPDFPIPQVANRVPGPDKEPAARAFYQKLLDGDVSMDIDAGDDPDES